MDDVEEFTPKDLEVLPNKIVHDILQYGITHDSLSNDPGDDSAPGVSRNSKRYNPKNRKFKKEALCSMNRVASLFVLYITTVAESIAKSNKRSTVYDRDILQALRQCMFWEVETQITDSENSDLRQQSSHPETQSVENDVEIEAEDELEADPEDDSEPMDDVYMDEDLEETDVENAEPDSEKNGESSTDAMEQHPQDHEDVSVDVDP